MAARKASGRNVAEDERGERGEKLQVRVTRGTSELLERLAHEYGQKKGEIVERALLLLDKSL